MTTNTMVEKYNIAITELTAAIELGKPSTVHHHAMRTHLYTKALGYEAERVYSERKVHPPSRPEMGFTLADVKKRNLELDESNEWWHVHDLHNKVIVAQNEFNSALKAYLTEGGS